MNVTYAPEEDVAVRAMDLEGPQGGEGIDTDKQTFPDWLEHALAAFFFYGIFILVLLGGGC